MQKFVEKKTNRGMIDWPLDRLKKTLTTHVDRIGSDSESGITKELD